MHRLVLTFAASVFALQFAANKATAVEVYLFKGSGDFSFISENMHFSRGLDRIADQLNKEGIHAEVHRFGETADALRTIQRRRPNSVAFVGHSAGAIASMSLARKMRAEGVEVSYVGTLDIPGPIAAAGRNVKWAENYYTVAAIFALLTNANSHPNARNILVAGHIHATLDDSEEVRDGILAAIREIHAAEQNGDIAPVETPEVARELAGSESGAGSAGEETRSDSGPLNLLPAL